MNCVNVDQTRNSKSAVNTNDSLEHLEERVYLYDEALDDWSKPPKHGFDISIGLTFVDYFEKFHRTNYELLPELKSLSDPELKTEDGFELYGWSERGREVRKLALEKAGELAIEKIKKLYPSQKDLWE